MMNVPHYEDRISKLKLFLPKPQLFCKRLFISFSTNTIEQKKDTPFSREPTISLSWISVVSLSICTYLLKGVDNHSQTILSFLFYLSHILSSFSGTSEN